jgi:hypothetical protein
LRLVASTISGGLKTSRGFSIGRGFPWSLRRESLFALLHRLN